MVRRDGIATIGGGDLDSNRVEVSRRHYCVSQKKVCLGYFGAVNVRYHFESRGQVY